MQNKQAAKPKEKKYFTVKVEAHVPATITYRVFAETEEDAIKQIDRQAPTHFQPKINLGKKIKISVYNSGSNIIRLVKNFVR